MGQRTTQIKKIIKQFKKKIEKEYKLQHLILFGSQARGNATKDSDIDLIVVSPKFQGKKTTKAAAALYEEWHIRQRVGLPVDFLCYSPTEFKKQKQKISIVSQAIKEGIEI